MFSYTDNMTLRITHKTSAAAVLGLIALFGQAQASNAATLTSTSVTSTGAIGTTGTNATPIVVTATAVTGSPSNNFIVGLPTGWSFVTPSSGSTCEGFISVTGYTMSACQAINVGSGGFAPLIGTAIIPSGTTVSVTFAANSLNVAAGREFNLQFADTVTGGTTIDTGTATLAGGGAPEEEENEPESGSTDTLAQTGFDGLAPAGAGVALFILGVSVAWISRVRRSN